MKKAVLLIYVFATAVCWGKYSSEPIKIEDRRSIGMRYKDPKPSDVQQAFGIAAYKFGLSKNDLSDVFVENFSREIDSAVENWSYFQQNVLWSYVHAYDFGLLIGVYPESLFLKIKGDVCDPVERRYSSFVYDSLIDEVKQVNVQIISKIDEITKEAEKLDLQSGGSVIKKCLDERNINWIKWSANTEFEDTAFMDLVGRVDSFHKLLLREVELGLKQEEFSIKMYGFMKGITGYDLVEPEESLEKAVGRIVCQNISSFSVELDELVQLFKRRAVIVAEIQLRHRSH